MVNQGKNTSQFRQVTSPNDLGDRVVIVYAANTNVAQTATISLTNLFSNSSNLTIVVANLVYSNIQSDPTHSNSLTIEEGTLFFSNDYGYFATSNNNVLRWQLQTF